MRIGFDAKRAYHNGTGLGHYSRTLIQSLAEGFPEHEYYLFNPKTPSSFTLTHPSITEVLPTRFFSRIYSSAWRSSWVTKDLKRLGIDLYHGLSHEIPFGIEKTGIKSVVTMHDLIPERHPEQYAAWDVMIYKKKFRFACEKADHIIAISNQTKEDIINYYGIDSNKITVCYQSCNPSFAQAISQEQKEIIRRKYNLPAEYFLSVGSIIERKNLLLIIKAMQELKGVLDIPLVVIGGGDKYKLQVKDLIKKSGLENKVIFLSEQDTAQDLGYKNAIDFPAIYQMSIALIYPSFFEGFGIPVLEGLWSKVPVITSNVSCLPEAGGKGAYYVNPNSSEELANAMQRIYSDHNLADTLKQLGWEHAQNFTPAKCAENVMGVYLRLMNKK
jgi:glycosyltransferase involved in cell wall biosynthesis